LDKKELEKIEKEKKDREKKEKKELEKKEKLDKKSKGMNYYVLALICVCICYDLLIPFIDLFSIILYYLLPCLCFLDSFSSVTHSLDKAPLSPRGKSDDKKAKTEKVDKKKDKK
jgi:hypothetical protein